MYWSTQDHQELILPRGGKGFEAESAPHACMTLVEVHSMEVSDTKCLPDGNADAG